MGHHEFQTEVGQLLHLITHSLYSNPEIFLRELISNASDALDKLKYLSLQDDRYRDLAGELSIEVRFTEGDGALIEVSDNGVGMNEQDLVSSLGTIARSGTRDFLAGLSGDAKKDSGLIGQFGVGFYSAFIVSDTVDVISRKAGEDSAWKWTSDGKGSYEISPAERQGHGTTVICHLTEDGKRFASRYQLEQIIRKYSDHIAFPIFLHFEQKDYDSKGKETGSSHQREQVNRASAIWRRPKSELTEEEYKSFFQALGHDDGDPLITLHTQAEGTLEYTTLFYVPEKAPFDLYYADYRPGVKLYVKRVFITDDERELMPTWLRFVRGVIDSEDLPLNVSREILQQNRVLQTIKSQSVKKLLGEFARIAVQEPERYEQFVAQYNRPLKEGLYQDFSHREQLMDLVRFKSTEAEGYTSLAKYVERMLADQKAIYYLSGGTEAALRNSPLLEAYRKRKLEVLIMHDDIDELIAPVIGRYKDHELKAINRSDANHDITSDVDEDTRKQAEPAVDRIRKALGDRVKDVRLSTRLTDSPSAVVVDEGDPTWALQQMMKALGQGEESPTKPILEINPSHPVVLRIARDSTDDTVSDLSAILLDQALLVEGVALPDPADFIRRVNRVISGA